MMDIKVYKENTLAEGLIERTSSMLNEAESTNVHNDDEDD